MKRAYALLFALLLHSRLSASEHFMGRPQALKFAQELLPQILEMLSFTAIAAAGTHQSPHYAAVALEKDEYIYSLLDKKFIRVIKDRYELPAWRLCGDWASVRVSLMGDSMQTVAPVSLWFLAYRDGRWVRLQRDEEGRFFKNLEPADLPPYAVRCFNLDNRDIVDH